jgi:transcription elongation factor GreA
MDNNQYISKEGLEKMKKELEERVSVLRPEIALRIKEAKEQGDLSENAEFDAAKEAQSFNEGRIEELKVMIDNAVIIDHKNDSSFVSVGSTLKVESNGKDHTYSIVGAVESDPVAGYISNESPLGKAFLGKGKGEQVVVQTPKGEVKYKIVEIK